MSGALRPLVLGAVLLLICVGLGLQIAHQSQRVRALYGELQQNQRDQDALLAEHSRLLLERATLASYHNVDRLAEQELGMRFPDRVVPVGGLR